MVCYKNDEGKYVECNRFPLNEEEVEWTTEDGMLMGTYHGDSACSRLRANSLIRAEKMVLTLLKSAAARRAGWVDPPTPSPAAQ